MIIDGTKIAEKILENVHVAATDLRKKGKRLKIICVLVGNDKSSLNFIRKKQRSCEAVGIEFELKQFDKEISEERLLEEIKNIESSRPNGIIIQLPLPRHINKTHVLSLVNPREDVDCLTPTNLGLLVSGDNKILPPAAAAVSHILEENKIDLFGKHIVIVGRGDLVGKPLAILLTHKECTITSCNRQTKNLGQITKQADIIISCAGVVKLIRRKDVKRGAIVIDVGTNYFKGKLCGDVDFKEVEKIASFITPVPGGVGPVMVAKLLENVIILNQLNK